MNDFDDISKFDNHETSTKLPLGWVVLAVAMLAFAVYYIVSYTPVFSGWTQAGAYEETVNE